MNHGKNTSPPLDKITFSGLNKRANFVEQEEAENPDKE